MKNLIATVTIEKTAEKDNWEIGCHGGENVIVFDEFQVEFTDKHDFVNKLAAWASNHFDITETSFTTYVHNNIDNNRFDYSQNEDEEGSFKHITEQDPDGYHCRYTFYVNEVLEVSQVQYTF